MRATLAATFMLTSASARLAHVGIIIPIAVLLVVAGCVLIGQGLYIHAKAVLAQILLERAFAQTLATGQDVKPWSWADTWPVARVAGPRRGQSEIVRAGPAGAGARVGPGPCGAHAAGGRAGPRRLCGAPRHAFLVPGRCRGRRRNSGHPPRRLGLPLSRHRHLGRALGCLGHRPARAGP